MSMNDPKLYLVLGGGDIGFTVASEQKKLEKEPVSVVPNELMVEQLKWLGFRALAGGFSSLREAGMAVRRLES